MADIDIDVFFRPGHGFGYLLVAAKERQGLTWYEIGRRAHCDPSHLVKYAYERRTISWETVQILARVLHAPELVDAARAVLERATRPDAA